MKAILVIAVLPLLVTGCTGGCLANRVQSARTVAEVNAILDGRIARVYLADGQVVSDARDVQISGSEVRWHGFGPGKTKQLPLTAVDRITLNRGGTATLSGMGIGMLTGLVTGVVVAGVVYGSEEGPYSGLVGAFGGIIGMGAGAIGGLIVGLSREPAEKEIVVYEGDGADWKATSHGEE